MDSSDAEVLLESCCLVIIIRSKSKEIGKGRCVSMIENRISGYLYNELFSESKKENVRPFKVWLGPLLFIKMLLNLLNCSPSIFLPVHLSSFISFFIKARILLQFLSQAFSILYISSRFSFVFML